MTILSTRRTPAVEHVLMLFVDGLGIGEARAEINPCTQSPGLFRHFLGENFPKRIAHGGYAVGLDANLDWPGLPQSATGQTALLTGVNASKLLGRHLNGFPNQALRDVIAERSLLKMFVEKGLSAAFLNTFRPPFFDFDPQDIIAHLSATSLANLAAGLPFFTLEDLLNERSIYQDIIGEALREKGFDAPLFSPEKAGKIIGRRAQDYHFTLFEYFQTDKAGHRQEFAHASVILKRLEDFTNAVLAHVNLQNTFVILTSDHGNIEDLSWRGHTRNPAMTLLFGAGAEQAANRLTSILDVYPFIISLFF
jgi:2,3-bisphosphoglycerate-independent phosphoglycerate mutase